MKFIYLLVFILSAGCAEGDAALVGRAMQTMVQASNYRVNHENMMVCQSQMIDGIFYTQCHH